MGYLTLKALNGINRPRRRKQFEAGVAKKLSNLKIVARSANIFKKPISSKTGVATATPVCYVLFSGVAFATPELY